MGSLRAGARDVVEVVRVTFAASGVFPPPCLGLELRLKGGAVRAQQRSDANGGVGVFDERRKESWEIHRTTKCH